MVTLLLVGLWKLLKPFGVLAWVRPRPLALGQGCPPRGPWPGRPLGLKGPKRLALGRSRPLARGGPWPAGHWGGLRQALVIWWGRLVQKPLIEGPLAGWLLGRGAGGPWLWGPWSGGFLAGGQVLGALALGWGGPWPGVRGRRGFIHLKVREPIKEFFANESFNR